jgi:hypothetical protein
MAYRAPELFDVKTGVTLDEKVDIWVSSSAVHLLQWPYPYVVTWLHPFRPGILTLSI